MPSRGSNVLPSSAWHLAQIAIEEAEKQALKGTVGVFTLPHNYLYECVTVEAQLPRFIYTAHYRQTPDGWPAKGRTTRNLSRHDAISEVADNAEVGANRALAADYAPTPALPLSDELERLYAVVVNDQPLPGGRSF